jgi:type IV pilus assembly protein PilB
MAKTGGIGDLLVREGIIDSRGLSRAQDVQAKRGIPLGTAIATLGLGDEDTIVATIAKSLRLESLGPETCELDPDLGTLLPADFCRKRTVAPIKVGGKGLKLALTDPMDYATIQDVEFRTGKRVVLVLCTHRRVLDLIQRLYPQETQAHLGEAQGEVETVGEEIEVVDPAKLAKDTQLPPVIKLVNLILSGAAQSGASDIHMEPKEGHLQIRYRVDGLLREALNVSRGQMDATISRMKIISGMDIADRRRPQDGRSRLRFEGKRIDLRVSTLPTQFGEKVVIRLLDSKRAQVTMEQLGLAAENLRAFQLMLSRPQGMILVTGPTGSGKSSTLYTALNWVKSPTKNIITVEDPIEYQLDGINQVQINNKAGVTFAAGLRSILRQDPNIILVGEIRDQETAGIALEAAQTGHLLLSTLHTNDAPGTITRLFDLRIEPFLISSAVICVLAQRLVRTPCPACAVAHTPGPEVLERVGRLSHSVADPRWVVGHGCEACQHTGSKGRLAIHELLIVNDEIRELISRRAPEHAIRKAARNAGMQTLLEDGVAKAARGLTTLEEVVRVVAADESAAQSEEATRPGFQEPSDVQDSSLLEPQLTMPKSRVDLRDIKETQSDESSVSAEARRDNDGGNQQISVLVVEDSPTVASVVKYFLELEGFQVRVAKDGNLGLQSAKDCRPNIVVTDYDMPGMDGVAMVKALRTDPLTRHVAVIMLTSEANIDKEMLAMEAGVDDYIQKPVEPRRLAARVKALLARVQRHSPIEDGKATR